jgi:prephenate dehydrogenase
MRTRTTAIIGQQVVLPVLLRSNVMGIQTLAIVGVGLLGSSLGLAVRQRGLAAQIVGVGRHADRLEIARQRGAIDRACLDLAEGVREAQVVVFCTPVACIAEQVLHAAPHCQAGALLTDVGSVKGPILQAVEGHLPPTVAFVGSHPLAGSEKQGPEHGRADLFQGRLVVVTPTPRTEPAALDRTCDFWQALGARVTVLSPQEHDEALAWTSHLPHLTAAALAGILPLQWRELTATGFRDCTRIAAGDPALWTEILSYNRRALLCALTVLGQRLQQFQQALAAGDLATLDLLLREAKKVRDALGS